MSLVKLTDKQVSDLKKGCPVIKNKFDIGTAINQIIDYLNGGAAPTITIDDEQIKELNNMCRLKGSNLGTKIKDLLDSAKNHKDVSELNTDQIKALNHVCFGLKIAELGQKLSEVITTNNSYHPGPTPQDDYQAYDSPVVIYDGEAEFVDNEDMVLSMIPLTDEVVAQIKSSGKMNFSIDNVDYIDSTWELPFINANLMHSTEYYSLAWGNIEPWAVEIQGMSNIHYPLASDLPFLAFSLSVPDQFTGLYIISTDTEVLGAGTHTVHMEMLGDRESDVNNILVRSNYVSDVCPELLSDGVSIPGSNYQNPLFWMTEEGGSVIYHISPAKIKSSIVDGSINVLPYMSTSDSTFDYNLYLPVITRPYTDEEHQEEYAVSQLFRQVKLKDDSYYQGIVSTGAENIDDEGTHIDELDFNYCDFMDNSIKYTTEKSAYSIPTLYHKNRELTPVNIGTSAQDTQTIGGLDMLSDTLGKIVGSDINLQYAHIWEGISAGNIRSDVDTITLSVKLEGESNPHVFTVDPRLFYDALDTIGGTSKFLGYNDLIAYRENQSNDRDVRRKSYAEALGITSDQMNAFRVDDHTDFCLVYNPSSTHYIGLYVFTDTFGPSMSDFKLFDEISLMVNYK